MAAKTVTPYIPAGQTPDGGSSTKNYACLRNSILTIADKNTHSDKSLPGNTRTANQDYDRSGDVNPGGQCTQLRGLDQRDRGLPSRATRWPMWDGNGTNRTTTNPTSGLDTTLANLGIEHRLWFQFRVLHCRRRLLGAYP